MQACFFLLCHADSEPRMALEWIAQLSREIDGLRRVVMHGRAQTANVDPLSTTHAASDPHVVVQWYFDDLGKLETALRFDGPVERIVHELYRASRGEFTFVQQAMAVRSYATPESLTAREDIERCTYLVSYEGEAENLNAWLTHYLMHHPPLMAQLPGVRELEIYTRLDYRCALDIPRSNAMQRNKVVFDDADALKAALASPIRARMKQDFNAFPPYHGATPHFPMQSIYGNLKPA